MIRMMDNGESDVYSGKYTGKTMCGFVNGMTYAIKISKEQYGYTVEELSEVVEDQSSAAIRYASVKSIEKNWDIE